jgi:arylsulfatase A-like enzyme
MGSTLDRRGFLAGTAAVATGAVTNGRRKPPNIVIMMTDDQRADAMGCAGHPFLRTPNMDRLAREGIRFRNAFVTNALCAPSRATLLTGVYSHVHGVTDNKDRAIRPGLPILPELLRANGYEVAFCGKSHVSGSLRDRQWDYYFGYKGQGRYQAPLIAEGTAGKDERYEGYMDDVVTDHAVAWLKRAHDRPFCLFLWFKAPHRSWERAPRHAGLFKETRVRAPHTWNDDKLGWPGKPQAFAKADNKFGNAPDVMSFEQVVKDYCATLTAVDENVGKVLAALTETGALDETAVLYTSDNGFFLGEWHLYDKRLMHEPSIRVPCLLRYPKRVQPGTVSDAMVLNVDIAPTVLELAGAPRPGHLQGQSAVALFGRRPGAWRKDWLYEYFEYPAVHSVRKCRGVRSDRYKLIHYYEAPQEWELYDLMVDPGEERNLAADRAYDGLRKRLQERLRQLMAETHYEEPPV